jgi:hypothetical protein
MLEFWNRNSGNQQKYFSSYYGTMRTLIFSMQSKQVISIGAGLIKALMMYIAAIPAFQETKSCCT